MRRRAFLVKGAKKGEYYLILYEFKQLSVSIKSVSSYYMYSIMTTSDCV